MYIPIPISSFDLYLILYLFSENYKEAISPAIFPEK